MLWLLATIAYQIINVNNTAVCFLNTSAGADMWSNCGINKDYLQTALLPWEWITGGYFSMVLVSIFVVGTYIKYHKVIYPILIGILFIPVSYFVFPTVFIGWAILMAFIGAGILVYYAYTHQTKEYNG